MGPGSHVKAPANTSTAQGREGHAEKVDVFFGNDACNRSADVKCVNGSPAWLLSNTLTAQAYLPRLCANASNSALSWTAEEPAGHSHLPWVSELCSTAERACRIPASPFSQLLHARRALIRHELDNFFVDQPERIRSSRPSAGALSTELPSTVILGLTTFNVVLKSLCAERHDLEAEVTSSVCSVLQGLPPLTEVGEGEASVLDSLEKLLMGLVDTSISRAALCEADAERIGGSLKALFLLSLLRSSLTGIVRAAHLTFRAEEALVAAGLRADAIKMDISGPHLTALMELCEGGDFGDDLSPLSDDSTLLGDINDDVDKGARTNLVFSDGYSSIATDGCYLYKHTLNGISKIGSGYGSEANKLYLEGPALSGTPGWLAHVQATEGSALGWLFFMPRGGSDRLECVDPKDLSLSAPVYFPPHFGKMVGPLMSHGSLVYIVAEEPVSTTLKVHIFELVNEEAEGKGQGSREVHERLVSLQGGDKRVGTRAESLRLLHVRSMRLIAPADEDQAQSSQSVHMCGLNRKYELGEGAQGETVDPSVVSSIRAMPTRTVSLAAGNDSNFLLMEDGRVLATGNVARLSVSENRPANSLVDYMEFLPKGRKAVNVCSYSGSEHVLVLGDDGRVYATGNNRHGQLGIGSLDICLSPTLVLLPQRAVASLSCCYNHSVAIMADGVAYAFGLNDYGQLGSGSLERQMAPGIMHMPVGERVVGASCGQFHTVVWTQSGFAYATGRNNLGQLGTGSSRESSKVLKLVPGLSGLVQMACGYSHTCAITVTDEPNGATTTSIYAWGCNNLGQLGLGHVENAYSPASLDSLAGFKVVKVACGAHHTALLTDDSLVYAFGSNTHGQLGQQDSSSQCRPMEITGLRGKKVVDIACGLHHIIALSSDSSVPPVGASSFDPELSSWYTNGSELCVHFPHRIGTDGTSEDWERSNVDAGCCGHDLVQSPMTSRCFSLLTGAHTSDSSSLLNEDSSVAFDRVRGVLWVADGLSGHYSVYSNIGRLRAPYLPPGSELCKFPAISEALLSHPRNAAVARPLPAVEGQTPEVACARSCSLALLSLLDIGSRSSFDCWAVEVSPGSAFFALRDLLAYVVPRLGDSEENVQLCILAMRMVRVNIQGLNAGTEGFKGDWTSTATKVLNETLPILAKDNLLHTPILFECCKLLVEGIDHLTFTSDDQDHQGLVFISGLIGRLPGVSPKPPSSVEGSEAKVPLKPGELLLIKVFLESVADFDLATRKLAPSPNDCSQFHASFRLLMDQLIGIASGASKDTGVDRLLASRALTVLLKGYCTRCKGQFRDSTEPRVKRADSLQHRTLATSSNSEVVVMPIILHVLEAAVTSECLEQGGHFVTDLLPWACTACMLFLDDFNYAKQALPVVVSACRKLQQWFPVTAPSRDLDGDAAVVESAHPCEGSETEVHHVHIPGATFLILNFDPRTNLRDVDRIRLYNELECRAEPLMQLDGSFDQWHSVPWLIAGDQCSITFESGQLNTSGPTLDTWGFRCVVTGVADEIDTYSWGQFTSQAAALLAAECGKRVAAGPNDAKESQEDVVQKETVELFDRHFVWKGCASQPLCAKLGASPILQQLVSGDEGVHAWMESVMIDTCVSEACETSGSRHWWHYRVRCIALACILHSSIVIAAEDEEIRSMWKETAHLKTWADHAQQQAAARRDSAVGAWEAVVEGLQRKASFILNSQPRLDMVWTQSVKAIIAFLTNATLNECKLTARIDAINQGVKDRAQVINAFSSLIEVGGSSMIRLLTNVIPSNLLKRVPMVDPKLQARLAGDVSGLLKKLKDAGRNCGDGGWKEEMELRAVFLHAIAALGADVATIGPDCMGLIDGMWDICCSPSAPWQDEQIDSKPRIEPGQVLEYTYWASSVCDVKNNENSVPTGGMHLTSSKSDLCWVQVKVVCRCEGDDVLVEAWDGQEAIAGVGRFRVKATSLTPCISPVKPGKIQEGAEVDIWSDIRCKVPGFEDGSVLPTVKGWVPGVLLEWSEWSPGFAQVQKGNLSIETAYVRPRKPLPPSKLRAKVEVSRDLSSKANVSVSSNSRAVGKLTDCDPDSYWQSDGLRQSDGSRLHWISLVFPRRVRLHSVAIFCDYFKDKSFSPKKVSVRCGDNHRGDLHLLSETTLGTESYGWATIHSHPTDVWEGTVVRIGIHECHEGGCNSRVRGVQVMSTWASSCEDSSPGIESIGRLTAPAHACNFPDLRKASGRTLLVTCASALQRRRERGHRCGLSRRSLSLVLQLLRSFLKARSRRFDDSSSITELTEFLLNLDPSSPAVREEVTSEESLDALASALEAHPWPNQAGILRLIRTFLPYASSQLGGQKNLVSRLMAIAGSSLLTPPPGDGLGLHWSLGVQIVYLLRQLATLGAWRAPVSDALKAAMHLGKLALPKERRSQCTFAGALCVLGGCVDGLRPGCTVIRGSRCTVESCSHDSAAARLSGGPAVNISSLKVEDEVPPPSVFQNETTFENLLEVMDGLSKSRNEAHAGNPTIVDSQLWAMASACVRWHIQSLATPQGGLLMQSLAVPQRGLLERLLALEGATPKTRGGGSLLADTTGSMDLYMPLFEVIRYRYLHGERAVENLPSPQRADGGPRSPQKQAPTEFPRDPAIEALAAQLTGLGYNQAICRVALRLNGGNAQAAGAWLLDHSEAYAEAHPEVLAEASSPDEESSDALHDGSSSSLVQLQAEENEWQMYQMPRAYPGASWEDASSPSVHSAPHIESVYRGQLLCVSNCVSSKQFDAADLPSHEEMIGRCGEVRAVNIDAGMVTLEFCEPVSPRTLSVHTFPIALLSRPDHAVEDGWGFALSLRGEALTEAFEELLGDRSRENLRAAICRLLCVGTDSVQRSVAPRLCRLAVDHLASRQVGPATPLLLLRTRLSTLIGCEGGGKLGSDGGLLESLKSQDSCWEEAPEVPSSDNRALGSTWCAEGAIEEIEAHLEECGTFFRDSLATFESGHPCKANLADDPQPVCVTVPKGGGYAVFDVRSNLPSGYHLRFCSDKHGIDKIQSFGKKGHDSFAPTPLPQGDLWLCEKGSATSIDTSWGYRVTIVPASLPHLAKAKLMTFLLGPSSLPPHLASRLVDSVYHLWAGMRVPCQVREEVGLFMACIFRSLHGSVHEEVRGTACNVMQDVRAEISWRTDPSGGREHASNESGKEVSIYLQSLFEILASCLPWQSAAEPSTPPLASTLASDDRSQERDQDMKDLEDFVVARGTMRLPQFLTDMQAMQATVHSLGVVPSGIKAILPTVQISLPPKHSSEADKALQEALAFASYFLGDERRHLPDDLLCQAWLCARSRPNDSYAVRESSQHPYKQGCVESGHVEFPGAEQLHVYVDGQSSTDGDDYLNFSLTEAGTSNSSTCIAAYSGGFGESRAGQRLTVLGSSIWYSFTGQHGSDWGYRFTVIPWYSQKQRIEKLKGDATIIRFAAAAMQEMTIEDDAELVRLINQVSDEDSLILPPAMITSALAGNGGGSYKRVAEMPPLLVHARIALLQRLNLGVSKHLLPYANLSLEHHDGSIANILSRIRDLLFFNVKSGFLSSCLLASKSSKDITVVVDRRSDDPVLKQLATHLSRVPRSHLKSCGMAFRVQFAGEGARGDSGPYRECLSTACSDLEGDKLRLLIPCPNMQAGVGEYSHTHVIRPSATTPADYEMLELMGVLFGISLRTRIPLDLTINPLVWLMVLGRPLPPGALALADASSNRVLESFKSPEASFDEESFEEDMGLSFQVALSDGTSVELCEGGGNMAVTWGNREEYARMAERTRLGESCTQAAVVRNSMHRIVPRGPLSLLSWDELDRLVTGSTSINVPLLRQHTVYRGVEETDDSVERFWEVIEGFSAEERKAFLRFVWARSRLPRAAQFSEPFKLHVVSTWGDERLPKADTCFFTLHLPLYSSMTVMRERLLYAISNCTDMDLM